MAQRFRFRNLLPKSVAKWEDVAPLGGTTDGFIVAGNSKFVAFTLPAGMGSTLGVLNYEQTGRVKRVTQIRAHSAHITDFKFLPYQENHAITASQDSTIKIWHIEDANDKDIETPEVTLNGHSLKVNLVAPHHAARGILASSSNDKTIKIWDSVQGKEVFNVNQGATTTLALEWSHDGNLLGTTWADKQVRIVDPRQQTFVREFGAHQSNRAQKFAWLGDSGQFVTTGFDQQQKRQIFLWDIRNTSKHSEVAQCSQGQGVLHPYFDSDLGILYTNGKGESLVRMYEYQNGTLTTHLNDIMSNDTTKGYGFLPKYSSDTSKNEIGRVVKLCSKYVESLSIVYPRKNNDFAEDLYPNCAGDFSAESANWVKGQTVSPALLSLKDRVIVGQDSSSNAKNFPIIEAQKPAEKVVVPAVVPAAVVVTQNQPPSVVNISQNKPPVVAVAQKEEQPVVNANVAPPKEEHHHHDSHESLASPQVVEQVPEQQQRGANVVAERESGESQKELASLKDEVSEKETQITNLHSEIASKDTLIAQLQEQLAHSHSHSQAQVEAKENFDRELASKESALNELKAQLVAVREQASEDSNRLQATLVQSQQENQSLHSELENANAQLSQFAQENQVLKQKLENLVLPVQLEVNTQIQVSVEGNQRSQHDYSEVHHESSPPDHSEEYHPSSRTDDPEQYVQSSHSEEEQHPHTIQHSHSEVHNESSSHD